MTMQPYKHVLNPHRGLALFIAFVLAFSLVLSAAFVLLELHHDCTGEHCEICLAVAHSVKFLKAENAALLLPLLLAAFVFALALCRYTLRRNATCASSPVSLKVKLSD